MDNNTQITIRSTITALVLLILLTSCSASDTGNTKRGAVVSVPEVTGSDTAASESYPDAFAEYEITEVKPQETPTYISTAAYFMPQSIEEMFAVSSTVVRGRIIRVREYRVSAKSDYGDEGDTFYKSVIYLKVIKNYSGNELKYAEDGVITFLYPQTSVDRIEDLEYLSEGDSVIAVLNDIKNMYRSIEEIRNITDYAVTSPGTNVYLKRDGGYTAKKLMMLAGKKEKDVYSLKSVEKVINDNIDLLKGQTMQEFFAEKYKNENDNGNG